MTTLQDIDQSATGFDVRVTENFDSLSAAAIFSRDPATTEGLVWGYLGGLYNGNDQANDTVTLTDNADNYVVVLRSSGVVSVSTSSTNSLDPLYAKIYKLTTLGGVVTDIVDQRFDANGLLFAAPVVGSDVAIAIHAATGKTTPVDADELGIIDSAASYALKKLTWVNLKATAKTYFDTVYQALSANLTALAGLTSAASKVPYFTGSGTAGVLDLDTDTTLAANSDTHLATQKALKTYIDAIVTGGASDVMIFKGVIDASANPNYPSAEAGNLYKISVAGKIGGASGPSVEAGDTIYCITDGTSAGNHATVGANWVISQVNIDGAVVGPASAVNNRVVFFDGSTGKLIKDSGLTLSGTNTGDETATSVGALINGATGKSTPVNADYLGLMDSAASNVLKKLSWSDVKATLKTYFDTLYATTGSGVSSSSVNVFTKNQSVTPVALTDGASIGTDASLSNSFEVTLGGNRTLTNPTNATAGMVCNWAIRQDGTGGRTLAYGSAFDWGGAGTPTLSTVAGTVDLISAYYHSGTSKWLASFRKGT